MQRGSTTIIARGLLAADPPASPSSQPDFRVDDPAPVLPPVFASLERYLVSSQSKIDDSDLCVLTRCYPGYAVENLPLAAWTFAHDSDSPNVDERPLIRCDPVVVTVGARGLTLELLASHELTASESSRLANAVGAELAEHGIELVPVHKNRWYAFLDQIPRVTFSSPARAAALGVDQCLPTGKESRAWVSAMSASQIALHDLDVNRERESRGQNPVSSVWFFGYGDVAATTPPRFAGIYGDHPLASGISLLTKRRVGVLANATADDGLLIALQSWHNAEAAAIASDVLARWRAREIRALTLVDPDGGEIRIVRRDGFVARLKRLVKRSP